MDEQTKKEIYEIIEQSKILEGLIIRYYPVPLCFYSIQKTSVPYMVSRTTAVLSDDAIHSARP